MPPFTPPQVERYEARIYGTDTVAIPARAGRRSTITAARVHAAAHGRKLVVIESRTGTPVVIVTARGTVHRATGRGSPERLG